MAVMNNWDIATIWATETVAAKKPLMDMSTCMLMSQRGLCLALGSGQMACLYKCAMLRKDGMEAETSIYRRACSGKHEVAMTVLPGNLRYEWKIFSVLCVHGFSGAPPSLHVHTYSTSSISQIVRSPATHLRGRKQCPSCTLDHSLTAESTLHRH